MTISPPLAPLVGAQQPRVRSVPSYGFSAGAETVELARRAGLHLDQWQQLVLEDALGERVDGKWAAFEVALIVPRQNGKGSILEALELGALFLADPALPPPLILHSAHEFKTSAEHFRRMRDLIERTDLFREQVRIIRTAAGSESIELHSGARLRFVTRTGGSGRGFSADLIVIDEAYNLTAEAMAAMLPTLSSRPNPQVWYTSSAGLTSSEQLARLRERGQIGTDPSLCYLEWSAHERADKSDPEVWAQANPALGLRIPVEFVERERMSLPDEQFARERLGIWWDGTAESVIDPDLWASLTDGQSQPLDPLTFAVDVPPSRRTASIAVAGLRADGLTHLEVVDNDPGTAWVVPRLAELIGKHGGAVVLDPAGPVGSLLPGLEAAGVPVRQITGREMGQACGAFYDTVQTKGFRHLGDRRLAVALGAAKKRPLGDAWAWHRKDTSTDLSPLVAVTLAAFGASQHRPDPVDRRVVVFR